MRKTSQFSFCLSVFKMSERNIRSTLFFFSCFRKQKSVEEIKKRVRRVHDSVINERTTQNMNLVTKLWHIMI